MRVIACAVCRVASLFSSLYCPVGEQKKMKLGEAALICSVIAVLLYMNTLDCGYCFDDHSAVEQNRDLLPQTPWSKLLENDFWGAPMSSTTSHKSYRPLTVATFRLNYILHELEPLGYHLVNVLLHSAVCYLYVLLCGVVFSEVWPALIAGLLFAVHPIHTEAVAGLVGRAELLTSILYIATILFYKKATENTGWGSVKWMVAVLLSALCSSLSKEQGITSLAVCVVFDVLYCLKVDFTALFKFDFKQKPHPCRSHYQNEMKRWKTFLARCLAIFLFTAIFMMLRLMLMNGTMPTFYYEGTNPATLEPTPYKQMYWLYLCFVNVWLLLNPSLLCADWSNGTIPLIYSVLDLRNLTTIVLFLAILLLVVIAVRRKRQGILFALSLLVLPYLPASNLFFPVGFVVAERILYLPSMGFCMLVGYALQELMNRNKKWTITLKPLILLLLVTQSLKTVQRNRDWYSEGDLWRAAVPVNPRNSKVFTNLAKEYEAKKDTDMVLRLTEHALKLQPNVMLEWVNVAFIHKSEQRLDKAEEYLRGALTLVPEGKKMSFQVGNRFINVYGELAIIIKLNASRLEEAIWFFSKAMSLETTSFKKAYWILEAGDCYLKMDDFKRAKKSFLLAYETHPESVDTNYNLAVMYGKGEEFEQAEKYLRRTLEMNPHYFSALNGLASILSDSEDAARQEEAFKLLEQATKLDPTSHVPVWKTGKLHQKREEFDKAKKYFLRALKLNPTSAKVLYSLGQLYVGKGLYEDAIEVLEKVHAILPNSKLGGTLLAEAYRGAGEHLKAEEMEKKFGTREESFTKHLPDKSNSSSKQAKTESEAGVMKNGKDATKIYSSEHVAVSNEQMTLPT